MRISDWSSAVCSSELPAVGVAQRGDRNLGEKFGPILANAPILGSEFPALAGLGQIFAGPSRLDGIGGIEDRGVAPDDLILGPADQQLPTAVPARPPARPLPEIATTTQPPAHHPHK